MNHSFTRRASLPVSAVLAAAVMQSPALAQQLSVYLSAPGVTTAEGSGFTDGTAFQTENFNQFAANSGIPNGVLTPSAGNGGEYTITHDGAQQLNRGPVSIDPEAFTNPDFTGGYGGEGQGNYLSVNGTSATVDISFAQGQSYFGFYWSAGDSSNQITFFDQADRVLGQYTTASLVATLQSAYQTTLTALNGQQYSSDDYFGQTPSAGAFNPTEPYGYLHFIDPTNSQAIYRVQMTRQTPAAGAPDGYFESDNHTVASTAPDTTNTPLVAVETVPVPEPGAAALALLAAVGAGMRRRR